MQCVEVGDYKLVKIENAQEAIEYGRTQWCTGRPDSSHYASTYSKGTLVAFFKKNKPRPQYQLFVHPTVDSIEFRDGGNLSTPLKPILEELGDLEQIKSLFDEREIGILKTRTSLPAPSWPFAAPDRRSPNLDFRPSDALHVMTPSTRIEEIRALENGRLDVSVSTTYLEHCAVVEELPVQATTGAMCFVSENSTSYVYNGTQWVEMGFVHSSSREMQHEPEIPFGLECIVANPPRWPGQSRTTVEVNMDVDKFRQLERGLNGRREP